MPGTFNIILGALLLSGTGGLIVSCIKAPVWDSECEHLYEADAKGVQTDSKKQEKKQKQKGEVQKMSGEDVNTLMPEGP